MQLESIAAKSNQHASLVGKLMEIRGEFVRKSLHMLIAFVPALTMTFGAFATTLMLALGVLFYTIAEHYRLEGQSIAVITAVTVVAARSRDNGKFVVGPVTLGIGAMLALLLYPAEAAFLAIYALAFGDGLASLVGRAFGSVRLTANTSVEGSLACFVAVFTASLAVTNDVTKSLVLGVVATVLEALPTDDLDNIILPVGVGLVATYIA
ncbi:MAG: diacylglycerol/polyprenol kinase family protein [Spirochaetales bacterium]